MIYGHGWGKFQKFISGDWTFADPLMIGEGIQKVQNWIGFDFWLTDPIGFGEGLSLTLAAGAEFVAALLVVLGLATRISALPLVITMLVAALIFHAGDPFGDKELPLIYATIFLSLFFTGPGEYSLDYRFGLEE